jgi:predicted nucleic acid-binding protein
MLLKTLLIQPTPEKLVSLFIKLICLRYIYDTYRSIGKKKADEIISAVKDSPITIISAIEDALFEEAGRLKATYKISLADAIALAEASVSKGILLTADHHEMDKLAQDGPNIKLQWIR